MSNVLVRNTWGSISGIIDPNVPSPGIAISVIAGAAISLRRFFASITGGTTSWRIIVFRGMLPGDVTALTAWDSANAIPASSAGVLGLDSQWEAIVPSGTLLEENTSDDPESGPLAISGDTLTLLAVPLVTGPGLAKSYVALSAYGGAGQTEAKDQRWRAFPRFPQSYSMQDTP